jgi:putative restriction endonuclease
MDSFLHILQNLNIGRAGSHERPHKPALLLAIISTIEAGRTDGNRIVYDAELFARFRRFFDVVRSENDLPNMTDPFWRLRTDGLLEHEAAPGFEAAVQARRDAPTVRELQTISSHSRLPDELYSLLLDRTARERLRDAIVQRYFASRADAVRQAIDEERRVAAMERTLESDPASGTRPSDEAEEAVRNQAFRRVVLRAYDYRCCACGLRVVVDDLILVEAAHLVPFNVSRDDDPRNGIALCRNHHWAMDRTLIAPSSQLTWRVSPVLDDRIEGQRSLLDLHGRRVIVPAAGRFHPKADSLRWREGQLLG